MSTAERTNTEVEVGSLPLLEEGQRLDRATFHERYEAMPPGTWAQLVGGVVYMSSPAGYYHGKYQAVAVGWLLHYERFTPGVDAIDNASTALDEEGEPQPDVSLRILPTAGGRTRIEDGILAGSPELIVEVSKTSRRFDLGPKLADYQRVGVLEYVVLALEPDEVYWHVLRNGRFERIEAGPDGLYQSEAFPGLWLDPSAFFARDLNGLIAALDRGLATPEHAAFVAWLAGGGRQP